MGSDVSFKQLLKEEVDVVKSTLTAEYPPNDVDIDIVIERVESIRDSAMADIDITDMDAEVREGLSYSVGYIVGAAEALDMTVRELFDQEGIK